MIARLEDLAYDSYSDQWVRVLVSKETVLRRSRVETNVWFINRVDN